MIEAMTMPRKTIHIRNLVETLPLFSWAVQAKRGGRPRTGTQPTKHCRDCGVQISRYSRGQCRSCGYVGLKRNCPDDFMAVLHRLGSQGAAKHFGASLSTVTRWRREAGMAMHERARRSRSGGLPKQRGIICSGLLQRDVTLPGQAADYLRQYGSVHRCDENGKPNAKGRFWRRNFSVLSDDEIIRVALKLRWSPEALSPSLPPSTPDCSVVTVSAIQRRDRYKPSIIAQMVVREKITAFVKGSGWIMNLGPTDARIIERNPDIVFVDAGAVRDLIDAGWEPKLGWKAMEV